MKSLPSQDVDTGADLAKGIGIVLVVLGHVVRGLFSANILPSDGVWFTIDRMIYLFHMPLFFYISGLFIQQSIGRYGYASVLKKTALTILVPLVVWSYFQFSLQYIAGGTVNNPVSLEYVLLAPFAPKQQFWFLGVLYVAILLTVPLLKSGISAKGRMALVVTAFLLQISFWPYIVHILYQGGLSFLFAQTCIHLPYFLLGTVAGRDVVAATRGDWPLFAGAFILSMCIPILLLPDAAGMHVVFSIICVLSLYKACQSYAVSVKNGRLARALTFIGMNSMIIYLAHVIVAAGFRIVLVKLGVNDPAIHIVGGVLVGVLVPLALIPVSVYLTKINPWFNIVLPIKMGRVRPA